LVPICTFVTSKGINNILLSPNTISSKFRGGCGVVVVVCVDVPVTVVFSVTVSVTVVFDVYVLVTVMVTVSVAFPSYIISVVDGLFKSQSTSAPINPPRNANPKIAGRSLVRNLLLLGSKPI
jgi:hypothetical protein